MKKQKLAAFLVLLSMTVGSTGAVFAADRDVWDAKTNKKFASGLAILKDDVLRLEVLKNSEQYYFEIGGKLYTLETANQAFRQNPQTFIETLKTMPHVMEVPGETEGLEIVAIE